MNPVVVWTSESPRSLRAEVIDVLAALHFHVRHRLIGASAS